MPATMFTARAVQAAQPKRNKAGKVVSAEYPDAAAPGLYLVVQPTGSRSWALRYRRPDGRTAKLTLGNANANGLSHSGSPCRSGRPSPSRTV